MADLCKKNSPCAMWIKRNYFFASSKGQVELCKKAFIRRIWIIYSKKNILFSLQIHWTVYSMVLYR